MTLTIRAHFDGRTIVPDEPVELPVNEPLHVHLTMPPSNGPLPTVAQRREALRALASRAIRGLQIPPEALRREAIYEDDEVGGLRC